VVKLRKNGKHKVDAKSTMTIPTTLGLQRILRPQAAFRWILPNLAAITPQYIEMILRGALAGNHVQQWELFDLMMDTWPELSACQQELTYGVLRKKLVFEPFHEEDEQPSASAIERSHLVSSALRNMQPEPSRDDCALEGSIKDILDGWFRGITVSEVIWQTIDDKQLGMITAPRSTFWVHPVCFAFDANGVLGLRDTKPMNNSQWPFPSSTLSAQPQPPSLVPFPDYKFLIAIHKAKSGTALGGPLLRPLAWWWLAANFSSDWLLNLAQIFGLPFRWANYDANAPQKTIDDICTMLQNMGSAAWAAFPTPTTVEFMQPNQQGSDHSPQGELLDRADRYCRNLILGQTMTGSHGTTGKGGGQAFGEVEATVKDDRIDAAGKFACGIINRQLIPAILALNYGDTDEAPTIKFLEDEVADLNEAQRDKVLVDAGLPIGVDYMRKKYDIPEPAEGEETLSKPEPTSPFGGQGFGSDPENPTEEQSPTEENDAAKASDQTGHPFRGNQYVTLGADVKTPDGHGVVVANDPDGAWVSVKGRVKKYKAQQLTKIPRDKSNFPSLTQSAENERRQELNRQLMSKIADLNEIQDDAVYARELAKLAAEITA
jgi:phage gp29-like protein